MNELQYFDDPNRIHNFNEYEFYPQYAKNFLNSLTSNGWIKTIEGDKSLDDKLGLVTIHNLFDYYRFNCINGVNTLESIEVQMMKTYTYESNEYVVVKEHKHKVLQGVLNRQRNTPGYGDLYFKHIIINFYKDKILIVDENSLHGETFNFNGIIHGFETEIKYGRLYTFNEHKQ